MVHDKQMDIESGIYRHYKGKFYRVTGTALHSETLEKLVVYEPLYENTASGLWVRPLSMFLESVNLNGNNVKRFEKVNSDLARSEG